MKANEFMVGDLATIHLPGGGKVTRALDIGDLCFFVNFDPVLLTPEILEKNDIHETNTNHWVWERKPYTNTDIMYQMEEICFDKEFPRKANGGLHTGGFVRVASEHGTVYCGCEYVHQLQHALRLCGIKKEITL